MIRVTNVTDNGNGTGTDYFRTFDEARRYFVPRKDWDKIHDMIDLESYANHDGQEHYRFDY